MRWVVEGRKETALLKREMRELAAAQKRTEASLKAFIDSMRGRGGNGHGKRQVDLE